jgi:hypothetical protein
LTWVYHEFTTHKMEQIHSLVTNVFLPNMSYYCHTICGRAITYLAVSIDLLGYYEYNRQLYLELGLEMTSITEAFYKQQDKRRETDQAYANKPERRKLQAQQRSGNINKEWQKEVINKQNCNTYQSAMMALSVVVPSSSETPRTSEAPVGNGRMNQDGDSPFCKACPNYGHQRRSSRLCPKNKKSKYYEGKTYSTES